MDQLGRLPLRVYSIDKYAFQKGHVRVCVRERGHIHLLVPEIPNNCVRARACV